jgi:hypothetical protein
MPGDHLIPHPGRLTGQTEKAVRELIARDPYAYWDDGCNCIQDSDYGEFQSPRYFVLMLTDPRMGFRSGRQPLLVVKIAGFFVEEIRPDGDVIGRFFRIQSPGLPCRSRDCPNAGGFFVDCTR